ncbi:unnamed protein product [Caenorhabditis bovis]|uniref:Calpain catalytic domain-containing protein n=1 Tax=Caenorhabditis bovis TaxID=2654633 RepID=A0A8S1E6I2_9PELO|nr:unnamed protein product [Caenorhabditis bovis]
MCSEITSKIQSDLVKENNEIYRNIVEICTSLKTNFIDDSFPHNKSSIGTVKHRVNGVEISHDPNFLIWLRPTEINTKDGRQYQWTIYNNPVPSDIEQGNLIGNCWLMSAMALIAEKQNILAEIFPRNEYSHIGVYQLRVCVEGQWKVIIVDDYFPCYAQTRSLGMAIGRRNQLWVPLIEKALAKAVGSYSKLHGASLTQGLSMLTGAACVNYNTPEQPTDFDTFWAKLVSSKESGFLMCCVCGGRETTVEQDYKSQGLLTNHAYSILDVVTVHNHRLMRIRNPWGSFVWNGKWSDSWPHWPPDLKQKLLSCRKRETGAFWMELEDFIRLFSLVTVCKVHSKWSELRFSQVIESYNDNKSEVLQFNVSRTCEASFMVFQKGSVGIDHEKAKDLMLSIHRVSGNGQIGELVVRTNRVPDRHVSTDETFLTPGTYIVLCFNLKDHAKIPVNIVVHSSNELIGEKVLFTSSMYTQALHQIVMKDGTLMQTTEGSICVRVLTVNFRGMIMVAENNLENRYLHISADFSESMNIQSSRGALIIANVIPPLQKEIVVILSTIDDMAQYRISNNLKTMVCSKKYLAKEICYEAAMFHPKLSRYPAIKDDLSSVIHKCVSVYSTLQ